MPDQRYRSAGHVGSFSAHSCSRQVWPAPGKALGRLGGGGHLVQTQRIQLRHIRSISSRTIIFTTDKAVGRSLNGRQVPRASALKESTRYEWFLAYTFSWLPTTTTYTSAALKVQSDGEVAQNQSDCALPGCGTSFGSRRANSAIYRRI
jgi:hypothetical protein